MALRHRATASVICVILAASALAAPPDCLVKGDGNGDCRIAFDDFEDFVACMTGPGLSTNPVCACYEVFKVVVR